MNKTIIKWVLLGLLLLGLGFLLGRWTLKPKEKIEYVKGEAIHDTIYSPQPYLVEVPENPVLPLKPDTIRIQGKTQLIAQVVDTTAIITEYIKKNHYKETLFNNDKEGTLVVDAVVQYNQMQSLGYSFTPIQKQITIEKRRALTPYVSSSVNTFGYYGIGGGLYFNNLGIGAKYITDFHNKGTEVEFNLKF